MARPTIWQKTLISERNKLIKQLYSKGFRVVDIAFIFNMHAPNVIKIIKNV